jgi:predicted ester cyclase
MTKKPENKKRLVFTILDELFNEGNLSIINQTCFQNITVNVSGAQQDFKGIEAFKQYVKSFHNAFADIHLHIDEIHEEGDLVDAHATLTATNIGKFLDIPPTQKEVTLQPVFFFKFDSDGKVVEFSQEMDIESLME